MADDKHPVNYGVKPGDVWQLGRHRLMCGSSASIQSVVHLMSNSSADCVFTSPPYADQRTYPDAIDCWDAMMERCSATLPVVSSSQVFVNLGIFYRQGHCVYYWNDWLTKMRQNGWRHTGWYIWDKMAGLPTVPSRGRLYPAHEFIFHFCKQPLTPNKIMPCASAGKVNTSPGMRRPTSVVYHRPKAKNVTCGTHRIADSVFRLTARGNAKASAHPAMFPVGLPAHYIESFTQPSQVVYDPFCGSGTTIIACEKTNRIGFGMEIAPEYVEMALQRWVRIYPEQPPKRATGRI